MNEYTRIGKGDEYVEVSMDWMSSEVIPILYMFKECLGKNVTEREDFKNKCKEVFELE